jgi:hypothetical protein|tara:strand:- start:1 stop:228 length:228 start_codon:yes stop_codon:yes gene_type:complete
MDFIQQYWEQLAIVGFAILAIVKMKFELDSLKKDVSDLYKRNTFIEVVTLKAEMEVAKRNITSLWDKFNSLVKKE